MSQVGSLPVSAGHSNEFSGVESTGNSRAA